MNRLGNRAGQLNFRLWSCGCGKSVQGDRSEENRERPQKIIDVCGVAFFVLFCFMERAHGWDLITMLLPNFASSSYSYSPPRRSRAEASSVASAGPTFSLAASTPLPLDGFSKSVSFSPLLLPAALALPFLCTITVPFPGETTREAGGREGADPSAPRGSGLELGSSGRLAAMFGRDGNWRKSEKRSVLER